MYAVAGGHLLRHNGEMLERTASRLFAHIDWYLFFAALSIAILGLLTMRPFGSGGDAFFDKQMIWIAISVGVFLLPVYRNIDFCVAAPSW